MDYSRFFSSDVPSFLRSPVREIFRKVDLAAIYSFAGGYPDAATFPVEDIKRLSAYVLEKYGTKALQYGATQGVTELREAISRRYGVPLENIQITTSSQQGIDVCTRILADPGDTVLVTTPTYLGALQSFRAYRANVCPLEDFVAGRSVFSVPGELSVREVMEARKASSVLEEDDSLRACRPRRGRGGTACGGVENVRNFCDSAKISDFFDSGESHLTPGPKFCYVIPDFQNPSGQTMTLKERETLVAMAREKDFLIVEDSPYRELRYSGEDVPTIYSLAPERTLHLGSFSKIFAPGFRLGWIFGPQELLEQIYVCKQALDLCPPIFDQYMAAEFMASGALDANLEKSVRLYRSKRDLMLSLLEKYMPEGVSWTHPEGGLFLFLTLPPEIDTVALYDKALAAGVAYVAGSFFYPDGSHRNTMRLNFSFLDASRMEEGVRILANIIKQ